MKPRLLWISLAAIAVFSCFGPLDIDSSCPWTDPACANEDFDGDGVQNSADNCPSIRNTDQADADNDGVGNACEVLDCAQGRYDPSSGLCWQNPKASGTYDWQSAVEYCERLSVGGHDDWRLPSKRDFVELLGDCDADVLAGHDGYCRSCEERATCSALFGSDGDLYWSSSPCSSDPSRAWPVNFRHGYMFSRGKTNTRFVRCVRSGP
jgi:hypothetical protein